METQAAMTHEDAIAEYQCPGCISGPAGGCPKFKPDSEGCTNHHPATFMMGVGNFALGMPKGFTRLGKNPGKNRVDVYASYDDLPDNMHTIYSVVVWKYLDEHGNTVCRAFSPRTNAGWSFVVLGDHRDKFERAIEITQEHIEYMD